MYFVFVRVAELNIRVCFFVFCTISNLPGQNILVVQMQKKQVGLCGDFNTLNSELDINRHGRAQGFEVNNKGDHGNGQECFIGPCKRNELFSELLVQSFGSEVKQVSCNDHQQNRVICRNECRKTLKVEISGYL